MRKFEVVDFDDDDDDDDDDDVIGSKTSSFLFLNLS